MTNTMLYAVIADIELARAVQATVSDDYMLSVYETVDAAIAAMASQKPEIILCEQQLLEPDQGVALSSLKTANPDARILTMGPARSMDLQVAALKYGSRGHFDISLPMMTLNAALAGIMRGEIWVERHVISELINELVEVPEVSDQQRKLLDSLSPKELEVAKLVSHGATNKMIAHQLSITERTVKAHLTATFQKMNISDRLSLAIFFRDLK